MFQRLYSIARATAFGLWRLLGSTSTVACKHIVDARSPQETKLLWALSHNSRQAHMVDVFSASTIGVLMCQGQLNQGEECDAHFRAQCNACQPPMLEFLFEPCTNTCTLNLLQSKWLLGLCHPSWEGALFPCANTEAFQTVTASPPRSVFHEIHTSSQKAVPTNSFCHRSYRSGPPL